MLALNFPTNAVGLRECVPMLGIAAFRITSLLRQQLRTCEVLEAFSMVEAGSAEFALAIALLTPTEADGM